MDGRTISIIYGNKMISIWDIGKGNCLEILITSGCTGLRILEDRSKIFVLDKGYIRAWSMQTWRLFDEARIGLSGKLYLDHK